MKPVKLAARIALSLGIAASATAITMTSCTEQRANPFMEPYGTKYDIPPFESILYSDYLPAVEKGIAEKKAEIKAIAENPDEPTFENTIMAMEKSGQLLSRVTRVFGALNESDGTPEIQELSETIFPMVSSASDEILMDPKLFARVKSLYDRRDSLNLEPNQVRAIELSYKSFVRNGALLSDADKSQLMDINKQLTDLYLKFNKNLLSATNEFELVVENEADLAGIPAGIVATAAEEAKARGKEGKWVFTLHAPSRLPVLKYADSRDIREKMYNGYINLASAAPYDNRPIIGEIVKLRARKADILGFKDFASYMTDNVMAKTPEAANECEVAYIKDDGTLHCSVRINRRSLKLIHPCALTLGCAGEVIGHEHCHMFAALDIGDIVNGNLWIILGSVRHFSELHAVKLLSKCEYTLAHIVKREVRAYLVLVKIVFLGPYLLGIVVVVPWLDRRLILTEQWSVPSSLM